MRIHKDLTPERWYTYSLFFQLANVGADIARAFDWRKRGDLDQSQKAFDRAMELLDYTILDSKNRWPRRKELGRVSEGLKDFFWGDNEYGTSEKFWNQYFYDYSYAAALERENRFEKKD